MKTLARLLVLAAFAALPPRAGAAARDPRPSTQEEEELFEAASRLYQETTRDKIAAIEAYERFLQRYPESPRADDAQMMVGEAYLEQALKILYKEAEAKKKDPRRLIVQKNPAAVAALKQARDAYDALLKNFRKKKSGLRSSGQYRLGEVAYNEKDWGRAIEEWRKVEQDFAKSYLVPESWMGIIFANLALEQFSQAEANLFLLGETYPHYLKVPEVQYVQGIVSLHKGDYANAERAFKTVSTPEAQFYLGKTYLLSKRPYLAAAAFESLVKDYPDSPLREETEFFIGDSFFLAKDFDGAVTKYHRFQAKYPDSQLRVSALFRIGSSQFQKKNYVEARAHFQSVIDRYPRDFFAPLAQYFIAESYLVESQHREALFAYTKVITQYPETIKISPLAHYKLAWSQHQVGDYSQAAQTCRNFLSLYPTHSFAKNVFIVLGNSLLALKRHDEAVNAFQRIIDLAPTSNEAEQALFSILQTYYTLKRHRSILTAYQFIFRHLPPSQSKWRPLSYVYAADAYLALNRVDEAKAIYEMLLKVYPNDSGALYARDGLAWVNSLQGDDAEAQRQRELLTQDLELMRSTDTAFVGSQLIIADSMYNQKQYDGAFKLYDKFVKSNAGHPRRPEALYRAGMCLYYDRYYSQAIDTWRQLVAQHAESPDTVKAEYQIADTLFRQQKYEEAAAAYKRIISKYPSSDRLPLAYLRVASSDFNAKDDAGALNGALALLSKFPDAPEAVDGLDLMEAVYDRSPGSDFQRSLKAVVEAVAGSATAGDAQFRIGRRLFELKRYAEAAAEFQRFSVDYTGSKMLQKAQFLLGESQFNAGKNEDAVLAFERFLENFPRSENTALALFHLGSAHYALKRYEPAKKYYVRLDDEFADSEYAQAGRYNLCLTFKALGDFQRAEDCLARVAGKSGADSASGRNALWEAFDLQKERKNYSAALETLGRVIDAKANPEDLLEALYRKGELLQLMGKTAEALNAWEGLLKMSPKQNPHRNQGLIQLGAAYEESKDYAKAIPVYGDLARNAPDKKVRVAARERQMALRRMIGEKVGPAEPAEEEEDAPGKTQVMPVEEEAPEPEAKPAAKPPAKPEKKPKAKPEKKPQKKEKQINIPGMN